MRLLLNGGGCGEQTIEAVKVLNEIVDHEKPILYIPLAMNEKKHPYDGCFEWINGELSIVDIPSIEMVRTFDELANKDLNKYSALFIGGGNTYRILKGLKDSGAFTKIQKYINNNGIVFGSSAGAIIFGYDIDSCLIMDDNEVNLNDTKGFNVLNGKSVFAHYTSEHTETAHIEFKNYMTKYSSNKEDIIAIPEEDTIFVNDKETSIIGKRPYYEFNKGREIEFTNESLIHKKH